MSQWTGYGILAYPRGRPLSFEGLAPDLASAQSAAQQLWERHSQQLLAIEIDRWEAGRLVESNLWRRDHEAAPN